MDIKKNDNVIVIAGKDRSKRGKILRTFPKKDLVIVEGVHLNKKHERPKRSGKKGQVVDMAMPVHVSNVALFCSSCDRGVRFSIDRTKKEWTRMCKKCKKAL